MNASLLRTSLLAGAAMLAAACSMPTRFEAQTRVSASEAPVRVESVYVYSFLDVREAQLGREFMKQFERILAEQLRARGVNSKQLWYGGVPDDSLQARPLASAPSSQRLPIAKVVADNAGAESAFNPSHRLLVTPAELSRAGSWIKALVRFDVVERASGKSLWTLRADTMHLHFATLDDGAEQRARQLVNGLIAEMQKAGMIR